MHISTISYPLQQYPPLSFSPLDVFRLPFCTHCVEIRAAICLLSICCSPTTSLTCPSNYPLGSSLQQVLSLAGQTPASLTVQPLSYLERSRPRLIESRHNNLRRSTSPPPQTNFYPLGCVHSRVGASFRDPAQGHHQYLVTGYVYLTARQEKGSQIIQGRHVPQHFMTRI